MSFDEYAHHLAQKYRLAISLAVIRTKPQNMSIEDHIQQLRDRLSKRDDSSLSVHSRDFNFDEISIFDEDFKIDDCTLNISDVNDINTNDTEENYHNKVNDGTKQHVINDVANTHCETNDNTQVLIDDTNDSNRLHATNVVSNTEVLNDGENNHQNDMNDVEMIESHDLNESLNILENFNLNIDGRDLDDVIDILKTVGDNINMIDKEVTDQIGLVKNKSIEHDKTEKIKSNSLNPITQNENIEDTFFDSSNIVENEKLGLTQKDHYRNDLPYTETHKEAQSNEVCNLDNKHKDLSNKHDTEQFVDLNNETKQMKPNINALKYDISTELKPNNDITNLNMTVIDQNQPNYSSKTILNELDKSTGLNKVFKQGHNVMDLTATPYIQKSDLQTDTQTDRDILTNYTLNTVISETENANIIIIDNKYIRGIDVKNKRLETNAVLYENNDAKTKKQNENDKFEIAEITKPIIEIDRRTINIIKDSKASQNTQILRISNDINMDCTQDFEFSINPNNYLYNANRLNDSLFSNPDQLIDSMFLHDANECTNFDRPQLDSAGLMMDVTTNLSQTHLDNTCVSANRNKSLDGQVKHRPFKNSSGYKSCSDFYETPSDAEGYWAEPQVETMSFKILEEMNKIKLYLRRNYHESSTDAGYRSDSQSRSSFKLSQSPIWLNQSAQSLLNYITETPLSDNLEDITNEMSSVLGDLIDRLHDEEKYPSFLEAVLDSAKTLLKSIYEGNPEERVLLTKDEQIQRFLLLNKSKHLQKFTIEKITTILQDLLEHLTDKQTAFELENAGKTENICYIFHVLQILLQKYKRSGDNLSQSTQNTQEEDRILRKSSISDIWRKKWRPTLKNEILIYEPKCPIASCADVLNKIIVNCMEGYSLISFLALKCFNTLQK